MRRVAEAGRLLGPVLGCWLLTACVGGTDSEGRTDSSIVDDTGAAPEPWTVLGERLAGAMLSVAGANPSDLWLVGADPGDGPLVYHHDGSAWTLLDTATLGDLWWVWPGPSATWAAGAQGRILRLDADGEVEETVLDEAVTLFGIWGTAEDRIWAVGGDTNRASHGARAWSWDGEDWTPIDLPDGVLEQLALYKVWGRSADDVHVVGTGGAAMHGDGETWSRVETPTSNNLFTVHGDDDEIWAVGGAQSGAILRWQDGTWVDESPDFAPPFNGVYARQGCDPVAVGTQGGSVWWRRGDTWTADPRPRATPYDLHAAWLDDTCHAVTVGGAISAYPMDRGVVAWGGDPEVLPPLPER